MDPAKHSKAPQGLPPTQGHCQTRLVQQCGLGDNFQLPVSRLLRMQTFPACKPSHWVLGNPPARSQTPTPVTQRPAGRGDSLRAGADGGVRAHR